MQKKSLESLQTLAEGRKQRLQRLHASQLQTLRREQERLEQLQVYLQEYSANSQHLGVSQSIFSIRARQQFVDRLKLAIAQQQKVVDDHRSLVERGLRKWQIARSRHLALQKYGERNAMIRARQRNRREQVKLDETGRNQFLLRAGKIP